MPPASSPRRIGVISDTHGLLRPEALEALRESELIIHAGDVGDPGIIDHLARIAPVRAVRGNVDTEAWAQSLTETAAVDIAEVSIWVLHDRQQLDLNPATAGFAMVISGHSHQPSIGKKDGVLYLNPGSAGPRRFKLPVSVARIEVRGLKMEVELVNLEV